MAKPTTLLTVFFYLSNHGFIFPKKVRLHRTQRDHLPLGREQVGGQSIPQHEDFIVDLGDDPPDTPKEGDLWYDTKEEELTLYIYTGKVWVPAAPPVSLDGIDKYCQR